MRTSSHSPIFYPAKLLDYDPKDRIAMISMKGLTDGVPDGIPAMLAYPIGDNDLDTERELIKGADVWVFFEAGDTTKPVVAFYRRHGKGQAVVGTRRIRQEDIELLARLMVLIQAKNLITIRGDTVHIKASTLKIDADIIHSGDQKTQGKITASTDVVGGGKSLKTHSHIGNLGKPTSQPQ